MSPDPLQEALLRVDKAQEGRERALKTAEAYQSIVATIVEVLAGQVGTCDHVGVFVHSCGPCVRTEIIQIIRSGEEGVARAQH